MNFTCHTCNHIFPGSPDFNLDGHELCPVCFDEWQVEHLKDRRYPVTAIMDHKAETVTTKSGVLLGRVVKSWPHNFKSTMRFRVCDVHGGEWKGQGVAGQEVVMHASKGTSNK